MSATDDAARRARLRALLAGDDESRRAALAELGAAAPERRRAYLDPDVARDAVAALDHPHRTQQRRVADALVGLLADSPVLRDALHRALAEPSPRLRWGAAYVLGRAGSPPREAWAAARETLALDDGDQRWAAAQLSIELVRAHPELRTALCDGLGDASATLRKMTLYCLRDLGDPELAGFACERLGDPDAGVRLAALAALARTPPSEAAAVAVATRLTEDADAGVRRAAAATLGRLGAPHAAVRAALEEAAASADPSLARAARSALASLRGCC